MPRPRAASSPSIRTGGAEIDRAATPAPVSVCPSSFPVTLDPADPVAGTPFAIALTGPSQSFGIQSILGPGVTSNEPPTTNPGTLTTRVAAAPAGLVRYTYVINGLACQTIDVAVLPPPAVNPLSPG